MENNVDPDQQTSSEAKWPQSIQVFNSIYIWFHAVSSVYLLFKHLKISCVKHIYSFCFVCVLRPSQ